MKMDDMATCHLCGNFYDTHRAHICPAEAIARDPLLVEREKTHGSFAVTASLAQQFKTAIRNNNRNMATVQEEALDMICTKIARIVSGNANERDHWDDIAGYAKLGAEACESKQPTHKPGGITYVD